MDKYITTIKDLVIQTITNGSEIKAKAESGDAPSCFQMGMIHLLGIDTPIDFKKASDYFGNQSLSDDQDANRMLGFIAECEGNYSKAFKNYANASKANIPYINKVYEERVNLKAFFKKIDLSDSAQNKIITNVLNEYIKGGDTKVDASIRIAMICEDEDSCLNAAQALYDNGDYSSAMDWLLRGKVSQSNSLYLDVEKKLSNARTLIKESKLIEVIEIEGDSLLAVTTTRTPHDDIRTRCEVASADSVNILYEKTSQIINEEKARINKQKDEETARIKKQQDEEAARIRKQKEEETNRLKMEQAVLLAEQEEQAAQKKKIIRYVIYAIIMIIGFVQGYNGGLKDADHPDNPDGIMGGFAAILSATIICLVIEWYINRRNKNKNAK